MRFTWDGRKNRDNRQKHGVRFETAIRAFDDPFQVSRRDRTVEGELRWQTIAMVTGIQVLLVVHTVSVSGDEEEIRIISARKATPRERRVYAEGSQSI